MSDAPVVKGWCPFHDRVVSSPDGRCPDCGRPLVALTKKRRPPRVTIMDDAPAEAPVIVIDDRIEAPPPSASEPRVELGPVALTSIVAAIVLLAFLSGLAVAHRTRESPVAGATPQAREEYRVGTAFRGEGVTLRLASFSQRGKRIIMRVDVPDDQPIQSGRIGRAEVEFLTGRGEKNTIAVLPTRSTVSGFIVDEIALERADLPVYAVKINTITLTDLDGELIGVDLSDVWRTGLEGPRSIVTHTVAKVGSRTFTLTGVVGWPDRLEARFELTGEKEGWRYDDRFGLIIAGQPAVAGAIVPSEHRGSLHVLFEGQQRGRARASILIAHESLTIAGDWLWTLPPGL